MRDVPVIAITAFGTEGFQRAAYDAGVSGYLTKPIDLDRMHQLIARLRYIFITHHHSDHNLEFGPLLYNAWITGLPTRVDAYGPPGLTKMTRDFFNYLKFDIDTRMEDEGRSDPHSLITAHDFDKPGVLLMNDDVKVSACLVRHPPIKQAYAYRIPCSRFLRYENRILTSPPEDQPQITRIMQIRKKKSM